MTLNKFINILSIITLTAAAGCVPNNAVLDNGSYLAFLADKTSKTLLIDSIDLAGAEYHEAIDCRCEITVTEGDEATCPDPDGSGACYSCVEFVPGEDGTFPEPLFADADENGVNDYTYDTSPCFVQSNPYYDTGIATDADGNPTENWWNVNPYSADGNGAPRFIHEAWVHRDSYQAVGEKMAPWRGEGIITTEGDLQVTFHHTLPGGSDFRFAFVVDPNFQPTECVGDSGNVSLENLDGDWLDNWSRDVDGSMYFLNAGSYQFNPNNMDDTWSLPQDWLAGFSRGKFAEEDMYGRSSRYGSPAAYGEYETLGDLFGQQFVTQDDLFYIAFAANEDPSTRDSDGDGTTDFQDMKVEIDAIAADITAELGDLKFNVDQVGFDYLPSTHINDWRPSDGLASGLDGWGELHYSWVHLDSTSNVEVGGSANGEFQLILDAAESQSRVLIAGEFHIDVIEAEKWGAYDIEAIKLEENQAIICGEEAW
jgi:hypothetical protein